MNNDKKPLVLLLCSDGELGNLLAFQLGTLLKADLKQCPAKTLGTFSDDPSRVQKAACIVATFAGMKSAQDIYDYIRHHNQHVPVVWIASFKASALIEWCSREKNVSIFCQTDYGNAPATIYKHLAAHISQALQL